MVSNLVRRRSVPALRDRKARKGKTHLVRIIPSIPLGLLPPEKSRRDRLNFVSWSTASFPTSASPTKTILSGLLTETSCEGCEVRRSRKGEGKREVSEPWLGRA